MKNKNSLIIGCLLGFIIITCCVCIVFGALSASILNNLNTSRVVDLSTDLEIIRPGEEITQTVSLQSLQQIIVPENDPRDLAGRLQGIHNIPKIVFDFNAPYVLGDRKSFWVTDTDTNMSSEKETTLGFLTEHAYFWIGTDVEYDLEELKQLAEIFENEIYPTNQSFFGSEWSPGVDGDEHIYIVYVSGLGGNVAGYFSPGDELHPFASEYSNAHELFMFNSDNTQLSSNYTRGVLAHEHQHMIHWYLDRNETSWMNEGFSELSVLMNGFGVGGKDILFMQNPDDQLNDWPNDGDSSPNYGSSFLFMAYFLDRMGQEITQAVITKPENGLKSIDMVLWEMDVTDPLNGNLVKADDLVLDWGLSNYIMNKDVLDGRFIYHNYPTAPQASATETIKDCEGPKENRDVEQYGTDYIRITCKGSHQLKFIGSTRTQVLEEFPYSGEYAFWSNKGDESDMTLTKNFNFSELEGPINLNYWIWYDLEIDYDYLYLLASVEGGDWEFLKTPSGTDYDPSGNSYGWGYNGKSETWIEETVDLSHFAGKQVRLRFEYITDAAVFGEGLLLDDISIPEINYFENFEEDEGGWEANGFARINNQLPQSYNLALITYGNETTVEYLSLDEDMTTEIAFEIGGSVDEVVLVIQGTTRYTRQKAAYNLEFLP